MIKELLKNIEEAYRLGIDIPQAWQAFWSHFGIKGNEPFKGGKVISCEQVEIILEEAKGILALEHEDYVKNNILEGMECLTSYAEINEDQTKMLRRLRSTYGSANTVMSFRYG